MRIDKIAIKHICCHADTAVKFDGMPIVAIVGPNGSGKTSLIESVPACFYGAFPTRPGSVYDRIQTGYEGEAEIDIEFEMNDKSYRARRSMRRTGKTTSSECKLWEDGQLKAGPKIGDFEQAIINLLGTQDVFLASIYSSQKSTGDLCDARPGERKAVFAQLLGLSKYDRLSAAAKDKARELENGVQAQELVIQGLRERAGGRLQAEEEYQRALHQKDDDDRNLAAQRVKVADLEAKIKAGEIALEKWRQLDGQVNKLDEEIRRMESEVETDRAEYKRLKEIVDRAPEIEEAEAHLKVMTEERDGWQLELQRIENENHENRLAHEKTLNEHRLAKADAEEKDREWNRLQGQAALLKKTPEQECCRGCSLVAEAVRAKDKIQSAEAALQIASTKVMELNQKIKPLELQDTAPIKNKLMDYIAVIDKLKTLTADLPKLREAQGRLSAMIEAGKAKNETIKAKKEERDQLDEKADEAMKDCHKGIDECVIEQARIDQRSIEFRLSSLISQIGALKERIAGMEQAEKDAATAKAGIAGIKQEAEDCRAIENAFGKNGIPQLLIEEARPELEDIVNGLLLECADGLMSVKFTTVRELKSGESSESLDIIISRNGQEMEIGSFSGGEQKILRTAIRLAIAIWQARKGGSRLRTLFLDEIGDALDGENQEKMIKLLIGLQNQFDRILIISHSDSLLDELPARINLDKHSIEDIK